MIHWLPIIIHHLWRNYSQARFAYHLSLKCSWETLWASTEHLLDLTVNIQTFHRVACMKLWLMTYLYHESVCWHRVKIGQGVLTEWLELAHCIRQHQKVFWHSGNSMLACSCSLESSAHLHLSRSHCTELTTDLTDEAEEQLPLDKVPVWKMLGGVTLPLMALPDTS